MNREKWRETVRRLSLEEFRALQQVIAEEYHAREAQQLSTLRAGDWVEFEDKEGRTLRGEVHRLNRRTVEIGLDEGGSHSHWRVSVTLVRRIISAEPARAELSSPRGPER
jgi:hypothetical protein